MKIAKSNAQAAIAQALRASHRGGSSLGQRPAPLFMLKCFEIRDRHIFFRLQTCSFVVFGLLAEGLVDRSISDPIGVCIEYEFGDGEKINAH